LELRGQSPGKNAARFPVNKSTPCGGWFMGETICCEQAAIA
jgi:hypothetical protein